MNEAKSLSGADGATEGDRLEAPSFETLELTFEHAVATVTLNRPDRANSMNEQMWVDLDTCFRWLDDATFVRVVILAGNGKHFCSGIDLSMLGGLKGEGEPARNVERLRRRILELQGNLTAIEQCRKPVLAAIHSTCLGGGIDMVTCCDMRYCTADAYFAIKEIDVGIVADVGTLQRLPYLVGDGLVRELAYTGRQVGAVEAERIGLINRVFENREALLAGVSELARTIAAKSPLAIRGTKASLLYGRDRTVADALDYAATWNSGMLSFADVQTAIANAKGGDGVFGD